MKKQQLEPNGKLSPDLLLWIKYFLQNKVELQKVNKGYSDDKKQAELNDLKYFDRKMWQLSTMEAKSHKELRDVTLDIKNNGIQGIGTFSTPLLRFYEYASKSKKIERLRDINTNFINNYIKLNFQDYSEWTQKNYYTQIRSLFKFIDKYSISEDNFIFDIGITAVGKKAKSPVNLTPKKSEKYLEPNEFIDFISAFKTYKSNHPNRLQPIFLMKVMSFTGIRASELRGIKMSDVSFRTIDEDKYLQIYINGKDDKNRYVFISYDLVKTEYEQEKAFRKENKIKTDYLFYTRDFKQYAEKSLYDLVKRFLKHAKIKKPLSAHALRRSYATLLLAKGVPIEKISHLLGHTSSETIQFYAFASKKSFKDVKNILESI